MSISLLSEAVSVPPAALAVEPMSIDEIDRHPDSARIWATIKVLRDEAAREKELAWNEGYDACAYALAND